MNPLPRQKLVEIVARHGPAIAKDSRRCEALLRDYCSGHRREVAVLVSAVQERVAADLLAYQTGLPREAVLSKLARRLHDNLAMQESAATWAVHSWALALGFISAAELDALEKEAQQPAPVKPAAATPAVKVQVAAAATPAVIAPAAAPAIVVSAKGDGDFRTLAEALQKVATGGRILLRPGLYREALILDKAVEIIGDGRRQEIVIANASANCLLMQTTRATVRGLTLRQEKDRTKVRKSLFAVDIAQGNLILEDCDITSESLSCIGIHKELTDPLIRRCRIQGSADSGIYFFDRAGGRVEECDISNSRNVGVAIAEGAAPTLRQCSIRDGSDAGLVVWDGAAGLIEECNIFANAKANVGISEAGNPILRNCRIYAGGNSGVFVHDRGQGRLEDCDIFHHTAAEVAVTLGGNLSMRNCRIHDGEDSGLFIGEQGQVVIAESEVYDNADAGVNVETGGVAAIRHCRINRNGSVAIRVNEGGAAQVEDCDLTDNEIASWQTEYGARIEAQGNRL